MRPAIVSVILGLAAIALAVAPFLPTAGSGRFVVSTVGLSAIGAGIRSIAARRRGSGPGGSILTTIGIGCGAIATLVMAATWTSNGSLPSLLPGAGASHWNMGAAPGPRGPVPQAGSPQGFSDVTLRPLLIDGAGNAKVEVVGNGGSLVLGAGYSVRSPLPNPQFTARLERRVATGDWAPTGETATVGPGDPLTVSTPPYSATAASETVQYRLATATSASEPISIVYENPRYYVGMAATIYAYAAAYCPHTAVHVADLNEREAGDYRTGALLIRVDPAVGITTNVAPVDQRALAIHECSHELQWVNYGGTSKGYQRMEASAAALFRDGSNGAAPIEHAADCGAQAVNPGGYLGYGGFCTANELAEGSRLLTGQRY